MFISAVNFEEIKVMKNQPISLAGKHIQVKLLSYSLRSRDSSPTHQKRVKNLSSNRSLTEPQTVQALQ